MVGELKEKNWGSMYERDSTCGGTLHVANLCIDCLEVLLELCGLFKLHPGSGAGIKRRSVGRSALKPGCFVWFIIESVAVAPGRKNKRKERRVKAR